MVNFMSFKFYLNSKKRDGVLRKETLPGSEGRAAGALDLREEEPGLRKQEETGAQTTKYPEGGSQKAEGVETVLVEEAFAFW